MTLRYSPPESCTVYRYKSEMIPSVVIGGQPHLSYTDEQGISFHEDYIGAVLKSLEELPPREDLR